MRLTGNRWGADFLTGVAIHFVFKGIDELRTGKKTAYRGQYSFDMNGNEITKRI